MTTTQMNTRIDTQLKAAGDAALAKAGYSPSQAIRRIWEWAAAHAQNPAAIDDFLGNADPSVSKEKAQERARKVALVQEAIDYSNNVLADLGLTQYDHLPSAHLSDSELRDLMYEEILAEDEHEVR